MSRIADVGETITTTITDYALLNFAAIFVLMANAHGNYARSILVDVVHNIIFHLDYVNFPANKKASTLRALINDAHARIAQWNLMPGINLLLLHTVHDAGCSFQPREVSLAIFKFAFFFTSFSSILGFAES
jgi:hypothetical protein